MQQDHVVFVAAELMVKDNYSKEKVTKPQNWDFNPLAEKKKVEFGQIYL